MKTADVSKRLRIALLTERFGYQFGGAESYAVSLFRILSQRHEVTVFALAGYAFGCFPGVAIN